MNWLTNLPPGLKSIFAKRDDSEGDSLWVKCPKAPKHGNNRSVCTEEANRRNLAELIHAKTVECEEHCEQEVKHCQNDVVAAFC